MLVGQTHCWAWWWWWWDGCHLPQPHPHSVVDPLAICLLPHYYSCCVGSCWTCSGPCPSSLVQLLVYWDLFPLLFWPNWNIDLVLLIPRPPHWQLLPIQALLLCAVGSDTPYPIVDIWPVCVIVWNQYWQADSEGEKKEQTGPLLIVDYPYCPFETPGMPSPLYFSDYILCVMTCVLFDCWLLVVTCCWWLDLFQTGCPHCLWTLPSPLLVDVVDQRMTVGSSVELIGTHRRYQLVIIVTLIVDYPNLIIIIIPPSPIIVIYYWTLLTVAVYYWPLLLLLRRRPVFPRWHCWWLVWTHCWLVNDRPHWPPFIVIVIVPIRL